jgi:hypothetical protein
MMCKKLARLICIAMIATIFMSIVPLEVYASVSDISGYWAEDVIAQWIEKGLANGYRDGTFRPKNDISRAEFMKLVNNAFEFTEEIEIDYKDVLEGKWYVSTIKKAKAAGYISGYKDGTMKPDNPITREEVAAIITRIMNLSPDEKGIESFKDKNEMRWSKGYIGAVATAKYMVGFPDGTFKPLNNITRGEAVYALNNIIGKKEVQVIAKQDFFGITYIRVLWDKGVKPSSVKANGKELNYDDTDKKWKGTSLDLEIGDEVEITVIQDGVETKMTVIVKDILDN